MSPRDHGSLDAERRRVVAEVWRGRADSERSTAETFRIVANGLAALDAESDLIALARRAVDDEMRHAKRCWQLACLYADRELPVPRPHALVLPSYEGATEELRHTLHVVGQCCLNETTASAFLERSLQLVRAEPVRTVLRELLRDEIDHARIGWAHLASPLLSTATRQAIAPWLPQMIATNSRTWCRQLDILLDDVHAEHGVPTWSTIAEVTATALDELILPGLRHVGLDVTSAP
jgi:hypothetical protein